MPYRIPDIPDALPLCRDLARQKGRFLFAERLRELAPAKAAIATDPDAYRKEVRLFVAGMLDSYLEIGVITGDQHNAMRAELYAFVFGATA